MSYVKTKPDPGPSPKDDASIIQGNFASFASSFANNHVALNAQNQGNHSTVIFENQTVDPEVINDLVALYNKDASSNIGTQPELFSRIQKFLPNKFDTVPAENNPIQLTFNKVNTAGPVYQSFLPGGYILYFGTVTDISVPVILSPIPTLILIAIAVPYTLTSPGVPFPYNVSTEINNVSHDRFMIFSTLNGLGPVNPYKFGWLAIAQA